MKPCQGLHTGPTPVDRSMRICDLKEEEIVIGLRIKSLNPLHQNLYGTIVKVDSMHDNLAWITWDGETEPTSGFYGNDCELEIMEK